MNIDQLKYNMAERVVAKMELDEYSTSEITHFVEHYDDMTLADFLREVALYAPDLLVDN
jgi:hypothetical protein